jgi:HlyD family secretion protein
MRAIDSKHKQSQTIGIASGKSGAAMDRAIEKNKLPVKTFGIVGLIVFGALLLGLYLWDQANSRSFAIENSRVVVSTVEQGVFDDFIPIRGRVTPKKTVYLDVIEGGQVEQRYVDDGAVVVAGQLLVTLNNTSLQLDVTRNEAIVTEQLNNMRTIELQLEQNRLSHKRNLVELNYQIKRLGRQVERLSNLDNAGVVTKSQLEDAQDELQYYRNRREVTLESQRTDARLQETQLQFLQKSGAQLEGSLVLARKNLESLNVRAPVAGKLSGLDVEVGQSIQRGGRLGQIDDPDSYKLRVEVDEFYLSRVDIGQPAQFDHNSQRYNLTVGKIYPQVNNGQIELDLLFDDEEPNDIRRGQTLQSTLTLGDSMSALIIPNGTFFQDTGGNWMFVLDDTGTQAVRRNVRLGRRNSKYIEVLDGLDAGERVITSPYSSFKEMDRLTLTQD